MSADRNLLFGLLAVQLDFVSRDALLDAIDAWRRDATKPLGDILHERGALSDEERQHLAALVTVHLERHGNDPKQSLAALRQSRAAGTDDEVLRRLAPITVTEHAPPSEAGNRTLLQSLSAVPSVPPAAAPAAVRYRILRPHARGGLGEVFVAEDTELGRHVALKEIQGRFADDGTSRSRFVLEAEITGGLEHPGIVPVYGLGSYGDGRPFYAMRFIQGDTLLDAIRRFHGTARENPPVATGGATPPHPLPRVGFGGLEFRDLLRRFIDVCNAVAYAHSRGVLHRDLKPGNVMLGQFGETLVVDWGLAKATGRAGRVSDPSGDALLVPRSGGDSSATAVGQALGTPAYISPEQAEGRLDELGPATDVYSLGATLYEVLTGRTAFHGAPTVQEVLRRAIAGEFPAPRTVVPAIPPPLDAICQKAMALKPADRYPSATALARDLERWLADEPVTAYPEPLGVRLRRWVRRHARLVTAAAAALAIGLVAVGVVAWQRERARQAVAAERDRAVAARTRTREALDAMVSGVAGASLSTQEAISEEQKTFLRSALGYYEEFAAEPGEDRQGRERLAKVHARLGFIRRLLGQSEDGAVVYRRAAELFAGLAADFPAEPSYRRGLAETQRNLGYLLGSLGRSAESLTAFRAALAVNKVLVADFPTEPEYRYDLARSHYNLANQLDAEGQHADTEANHLAARALLDRLVADFPATPEYRRELATNLYNLAGLHRRLGKSADAEASYRAAVALLDKLATDFPAVPIYRRLLARNHGGLGILLVNLRRPPEAEAAFRAALAVQQKLVADFPGVPDYRLDLAKSHNNLGLFQSGLGKPAEAEAEHRAALARLEKLVTDFPTTVEFRLDLVLTHNNLGLLFHANGRRPDAEAAFRAGLAVTEKLVADFPKSAEYRRDLAGAYGNLAGLLVEQGKRAEAEAACRAALAVTETMVADFPGNADDRRALAAGHYNLGLVLNGLGKRAEAETALRTALAMQEKLAAAQPEALEAFHASSLALSGLLVSEGKLAEAVAAADRIAAGSSASANTLYDCACIFARASAATNNPDADAHATRAIERLRQAIAKGYSNVPHMFKDSDLDSLRRREDFATLLWDLADALPSAP